MKHSIFAANLLLVSALITAQPAMADNIANCEIVLMETIEDENGNGSAQIASYRPAADFIASVYNSEIDTLADIDGLAIRALLCRRNNVIISDTDFKLLATGVPFILSQNFDSSESDLLTYFFKDGQFRYTHKGETLSEDKLTTLDTRLKDFNDRDHSLAALETEKKAAAKDTAETTEPTDKVPQDIKVIEIDPETPPLETELGDIKIEKDPTLSPKTEDEPDVEIVKLDTAIEETVTQPVEVETKTETDKVDDETPKPDDN